MDDVCTRDRKFHVFKKKKSVFSSACKQVLQIKLWKTDFLIKKKVQQKRMLNLAGTVYISRSKANPSFVLLLYIVETRQAAEGNKMWFILLQIETLIYRYISIHLYVRKQLGGIQTEIPHLGGTVICRSASNMSNTYERIDWSLCYCLSNMRWYLYIW